MRAVALAAGLSIAAMAAACSSPAGSVVAMTDAYEFEPATITVEPGTVEFRNESNQAHTVTAYEASLPEGARYFSSAGDFEARAREDLTEGLIRPGEGYEVVLDVPGTYRYFCIPHEDQGMTGTIVVE